MWVSDLIYVILSLIWGVVYSALAVYQLYVQSTFKAKEVTEAQWLFQRIILICAPLLFIRASRSWFLHNTDLFFATAFITHVGFMGLAFGVTMTVFFIFRATQKTCNLSSVYSDLLLKRSIQCLFLIDFVAFQILFGFSFVMNTTYFIDLAVLILAVIVLLSIFMLWWRAYKLIKLARSSVAAMQVVAVDAAAQHEGAIRIIYVSMFSMTVIAGGCALLNLFNASFILDPIQSLTDEDYAISEKSLANTLFYCLALSFGMWYAWKRPKISNRSQMNRVQLETRTEPPRSSSIVATPGTIAGPSILRAESHKLLPVTAGSDGNLSLLSD